MVLSGVFSLCGPRSLRVVRPLRSAVWAVLLLALWTVAPARAAAYDFPLRNPYQATVFGTAPDQIYPLKKQVQPQTRTLRIKGRNVPEIFWYARGMDYSVALQPHEAPLVFLIAGTGASHQSDKQRFLLQLLYGAGYHVAALSSPTHMQPLVSVSKHGAAGYVPWDVEDLYQAMAWIKQDLAGKAAVSGYSVAGYSLGGLHAAFLARLDESRGQFHFRRALMINPPVSAFDSARRFDAWLLPERIGDRTPRDVFQKFMNQFAVYYKTRDVIRMDAEFLYRLSEHVDLDDSELRTLIGMSFRLTAATMAFVSDVCLRAGYLVPSQARLRSSDDLMPYFAQAVGVSFEQYMDEYLLPYIQRTQPGLTREAMIEACSLRSIGPYLASSAKVAAIGNEDDPILGGDDIEFLRGALGDRLVLFPLGGHCGNLMHAPFAEKLLQLLAQ